MNTPLLPFPSYPLQLLQLVATLKWVGMQRERLHRIVRKDVIGNPSEILRNVLLALPTLE